MVFALASMAHGDEYIAVTASSQSSSNVLDVCAYLRGQGYTPIASNGAHGVILSRGSTAELYRVVDLAVVGEEGRAKAVLTIVDGRTTQVLGCEMVAVAQANPCWLESHLAGARESGPRTGAVCCLMGGSRHLAAQNQILAEMLRVKASGDDGIVIVDRGSMQSVIFMQDELSRRSRSRARQLTGQIRPAALTIVFTEAAGRVLNVAAIDPISCEAAFRASIRAVGDIESVIRMMKTVTARPSPK